jgi:hypothetical protein
VSTADLQSTVSVALDNAVVDRLDRLVGASQDVFQNQAMAE